MPVGSVIASVAGGAIAGGASLLAARKQEQAANKATDVQKQMFKTTRSDLAPFKGTGQSAAYTLADFYGLGKGGEGYTGGTSFDSALERFRQSPDYQFALSEGVGALDKSAAAKGLLLSGGQVKDVTKYASGLASENLGNYLNRLYQLASMGGNAAAQTGNAAVSTGKGIAETTLGAGEAGASGIIGAGNAITGTLSDLASLKSAGSAYKPTLVDTGRIYQG